MKMEREAPIVQSLQGIPESDYVETDETASTSSEIERIQSRSPGAGQSGRDSPPERGIAKTKKQESAILKTIEKANALGSNTLDLSNKGLLQIPNEVLELSSLEHLYLEGNELSALPDDFFDKLPNLVWLDLRRNDLLRLPSVYTGRHQHLRTLLLEGNNLRSLPLELGLIKSLNGLNISMNPLEFPPAEIIEKGTNEILQFLREMLLAKSTGKLQLNGDHNHEENGETSSDSDDWEDEGDLRDFARKMHRGKMEDSKSTTTKSSDLFGPVLHTAELHRPVSYTEMKQEKSEKLKKAGAAGTVESPKKKSSKCSKHHHRHHKHELDQLIVTPRHVQAVVSCQHCTSLSSRRTSASNSVLSWKVNKFPEPPPSEYVTFKMNEERRLAKVKDLKEKTDAIIQRRKDEELLREWRHESKKLQQKKYFESLRKGTKDFVDAVDKAPFDIDKNHMKIPTNEERIKQDVKNAHERMRRTLSPASRQRIEEEKSARIRELERRIKHHTAQMHERRKQPKGSPQEEMEAAKKELEIATEQDQRKAEESFGHAEDLHKELSLSRKNLEYRFRAFTADIATGFVKKNIPPRQ